MRCCRNCWRPDGGRTWGCAGPSNGSTATDSPASTRVSSTAAFVRRRINERGEWASKRVAVGRALADRLPFAAKGWEGGHLGLEHASVIDHATRQLAPSLRPDANRRSMRWHVPKLPPSPSLAQRRRNLTRESVFALLAPPSPRARRRLAAHRRPRSSAHIMAPPALRHTAQRPTQATHSTAVPDMSREVMNRLIVCPGKRPALG